MSSRHSRSQSNPTGYNMRVAMLLLTLSACHESVPMVWKYESKSGGLTTPLVVHAERATHFVAFGHESGVTLLTLDGDTMCSFDAHGSVVGTPRTDGRLLFFGSTNHVFYAIDATCKLAWKLTTGDRIKSAPYVGSGVVYFASADGHVYAADAATGTLRWSFPALPIARGQLDPQLVEAAEASQSPGKQKSKGRGKQRTKTKGHAEHGRVAQTRRRPLPTTTMSAVSSPPPLAPEVGPFGSSSPVVAEGVLYIGNTDQHLYALNVADGTLKWRFSTEGEVHSTPTVLDGMIYFGSNDGDIYAVNAVTHVAAWKIPTLDAVHATAHLADHGLYIGGNDHHIYAIDPAKGQIRWKYEIKGPLVGGVAVYKGLVLAGGGAGDGVVYAVRRSDQTPFWTYQTTGEVETEPLVVDDRLYVTTTDGILYVFNLGQAPAES